MFTVTKEIRFEAAHRLVYGYPGKCRFIHGHSWVVRVTVKADDLDAFGMARDFADFSPLRTWIDEKLDHAMLICSSDSEMFAFLSQHEQKFFEFPENPTSEVLAKYIYDVALGMAFDVVAVDVDETCTSNARYEVW